MYIADLHIHSKYSRATSRELVPEYLDLWARRKGIGLLGTGDFTHAAWREELREKLKPAEEGFYTLREEYRLEEEIPDAPRPRFVLSGEISSIYKKDGRVRKVHNVILLPSLDAADRLSHRLELIGNLHSDGRPILGLDSRDLLEIMLDACPEGVFIPAHIWTPHFSLFGAFSGFDTMEECYGDLTPHIHAVETGLSSDPPMNWRLSCLDRLTLVSNSDAHSPGKLGREANLFETELSYPAMARALEDRDGEAFAGTIEFFPEEGKYHFDGHRNCGCCLRPADAECGGNLCPVCGKRLTIGVQHRVEQLADRKEGFRPAGARRFESLVPLTEVIAASTGQSAAGKKTQAQYEALLRELGPEFYILRQAPLEDIRRVGGVLAAEGIRRMRLGEIELSPGYDGEYGRIKILDEAEIGALSGQTSLFGASPAPKREPKSPKGASLKKIGDTASMGREEDHGPAVELNPEQRAAVEAQEPAVACIAGPGTGKTRTLVARAAFLVEERGVKPREITAVTFTNKAAGEMRERLEKQLGKRRVRQMTIGTFHAICLSRLRAASVPVNLLDEAEAQVFAAQVCRELGLRLTPARVLQEVSRRKNNLPPERELPPEACEKYAALLEENGLMDFDDLLLAELNRCAQGGDLNPFRHLLVDEYQDINDVQYRLMEAWSGKGGNLFVIGDPDQAIYGFRGSDSRCFERLEASRPELRTIKLTRNYRSTPEIVESAGAVIGRNVGPARTLEARRDHGEKVQVLTAPDEFSQGIFVAKAINRMVGGIEMLDTQTGAESGGPLRSLSDIAVLYRTHREAEVLELCLQKEGIPYQVAGRDQSLQDGMVRGTLGFFRWLLDSSRLHALEVARRTVLPGEENHVTLAEEYGPRVRREKPQKLLEDWCARLGLPVTTPISRLLNLAVLHGTMEELLSNMDLGQEGDVVRSGARRYAPDAVRLMTLHGAKGLEFPVVFLVNVEKGKLPLESPGRETDLAEERRLFYVGMTRAKEELLLLTSGEPSAFLADLPERLTVRRPVRERRADAGKQLSLFD